MPPVEMEIKTGGTPQPETNLDGVARSPQAAASELPARSGNCISLAPVQDVPAYPT